MKPETNAVPLRVLTYNIRYAEPADGDHDWPHRRERIASVLRLHELDLCGLQEALREQVDDLAQGLPEFDWLGVGRLDGQSAGEFTPIFYRRARLALLDSGTFWLSETPEVPGSLGWDARYVRAVTWAHFRDRSNGAAFFHFNTHFDNIGAVARRESARLLLARMTTIAQKQPGVVTGDFNSIESAPTYRIHTGQQINQTGVHHPPLDDAMRLSYYPHHGPVPTLNAHFRDPLIARVDYLFVRNVLQRRPYWQLRVRQHGTLTDRWENGYPSDHLPVLAELQLTYETA